MRRKIPDRGDVYWVDPNPVAGREMKDRHRFVVITPRDINGLGVCMTVPVTSGGTLSRRVGLAVAIQGSDTNGVAVCNQVRSFDLEARALAGTARYIETIDKAVADEIVIRVISTLDPAA